MVSGAKETLGERMRAIRQAHGLSLDEIAAIMRITGAAVSQLERGRSKNARLEGFLRFCAHFNVDPYYVVFGKPKAALNRELQ